MTAQRNSSSTRELILKAAFSFFDKPRYTVFSLSEVAAKVGISKAAIFRHFANKKELLDAMQNFAFDIMAEQMRHIQKISPENNSDGFNINSVPLKDLLVFFADNPQYIYFFIGNFASSPDFEAVAIREMVKRDVKQKESMYEVSQDGKTLVLKNKDYYSKAVFCGVTIFYFLAYREKLIREGKTVSSSKDFADKLVSLIDGGMKGCMNKDCSFYPNLISPERKAEINKLCELDKSSFLPEDRIFEALAAVIKKYDFPGVTIERIADELNMAKSSLYSYFTNKNEMVLTLIKKEMENMMSFVKKNFAFAKTSSECLYIHLITEFNYLMARPSVISVGSWLRMSGSICPEEDEEVDDIKNKEWRKEFSFSFNKPDLGFKIESAVLAGWASSLPVSLILQGQSHKMNNKELEECLNNFFNFVEYGIDKMCRSTANEEKI